MTWYCTILVNTTRPTIGSARKEKGLIYGCSAQEGLTLTAQLNILLCENLLLARN